MRTYEGMFILHNRETGDPETEKVSPEDMVRALLEKVGAKVLHTMLWANRKLAYPIDGNQTGTYILTYFECAPSVHDELNREARINERVLRHMVLQVEAMPTGEEMPGPLSEPRSGRRDEVVVEVDYKVWEMLDYKHVHVLRRLVTSQGKMFSRVRSGLEAKNQRKLRRAVHRARNLALLPFVAR